MLKGSGRNYESYNFDVSYYLVCGECGYGTGGDPVSAQAEGWADGKGRGAAESLEEEWNTDDGRDSDPNQRGGNFHFLY